jgi:hypothetical protein
VLEAGVGWGRLLDPLTRAARRVTGIDQHPGLLARATDRLSALPKTRAARVRLTPANLLSPPEGAPPYDRVLLPFNTLFCLPDEAAQRAALKALRRVAAPGALLALDVYVIDDAPPDADDADFEYLITVLDAAGRVDVYERNDELPDQRIDVTYRCALFDALTSTEPRRLVDQRVSHRYLTPDQLLALLPACGWTPRSVHGDSSRPVFARWVRAVLLADVAQEIPLRIKSLHTLVGAISNINQTTIRDRYPLRNDCAVVPGS